MKQPWRVDVIVRGTPAGAYQCKTRKQATREAEERARLFGVLGCRYKVARNEPRP